MKKCSNCGIVKEKTEFWKRVSRACGVSSECKICWSTRRKQKYSENIEEKRLERKVYYYKNREKLCKAVVDGQKGNKRYRKYQNKYLIQKIKDNDPKFVARKMVQLALKSGMITRATECSKCSSALLIEGHHEDYMKPLDVTWLCRKCHRQLHKEKNENTRNKSSAHLCSDSRTEIKECRED